MTRILGFLLWLLVFLAAPAAAMADPTTMIVAGLGAAGIQVGVVGTALIRIGVGIALSYIQMAMQKQSAETAGIQTETTTEGGTLPQTRLLGYVATAGSIMMPSYSAGESDSIENAYRHTLIDLADHQITSLEAFWCNGKKWTTSNLTGNWLDTHGKQPTNVTANDRWIETIDGTNYPQMQVRFRDGTQGSGSADPFMVSTFGSHRRPFKSTMYGKGIAYVRTRLRFDPELYQGPPRWLWECKGEPVYNPRLDTSVGGSGTQRWATPSTYVYDDNLLVLAYNVLTGLNLDEGGRWGVGYDQLDLPYASWSQAIAYADATVGYGKRYRGGYEIRMNNPETGGETPLDVVEKLLRGASAQIADCGGEVLVRCGPPGANVFNITDLDVIVEEAQQQTLHDGINATYNSARVSHPHPGKLWEASEAPFYQDAAAVAQDGGPLVADLTLPTVPFRAQAKKVAKDYVKDSRRGRRHVVVLPWDFNELKPLDAIGWTSARHGYTAKKFEVWAVSINPANLFVTASLRERDPSDYLDTDTDDAVDDDGKNEPQFPALPGFAVAAVTIEDKDGDPRDAGIRISWAKRVESRRIQYQIRRQGTTTARIKASVDRDEEGFVDVYGRKVHPKTVYEVRARGRAPRTGWTNWTAVTTANLRVRRKDLENNSIGGRKLKPHTMKNLIPLWDIDEDVEPSTSDDATFTISGGTYTVGGSANTGRQSVRIDRTTGATAILGTHAGDRAPISGGQKYYFETMLRTSGASGSAGLVQVRAHFRRADGTEVTGSPYLLKPLGSHPAYDGTYRKFSDRVRPDSDARTVDYSVRVDSGGPSWIEIDRVQMDEANAADKIFDGEIGGRHAKKEDYELVRRFESALVNTAPRGTARQLAGGAVPCDNETVADIILTTMGDSLGEKIGGKMDFSAVVEFRFYAGSDNFRTITILWEADQNRPVPITLELTDNKKRSGDVKYRVDIFRKNGADSGCEVDFRHITFKVKLKKR